MDADSWAARLSSASKRNLFNSQSRSAGMKWDSFDAEMLMGFEEIDMDDDVREEYACPFCSEYFDIVGLCCHIDDEHPVEANNGMCPVCAMRVDFDMVGHITVHHANEVALYEPIMHLAEIHIGALLEAPTSDKDFELLVA
ncbi:Protein DEHYDRATION-INDUCED 19-like protein 6 [Forsythia ovata]|uniref:Protein DEHYDRATION-INDUCED 19-like protein 6 n=1 Tax=Forsythia ovata TaxID=205694 RepID=A0ABD1PYB7_9LAMI